jgi:hypothetical protein
MQKKSVDEIMKMFYPLRYTDKGLKELIQKDVDNLEFNKHCEEVAKNLNIDPIVVKDLLLQNSLTVLSLLQKKALKSQEIKINITGYFSLITSKVKYNLNKLKTIKFKKDE